MKIPKQVKIGSHIYTVNIVDSINENPERLGETDHGKLTIQIRKMEPSMMEDTFLHELFHCFNTEFTSHEMLQSFTNSLHLFIKDNPEVFK